MERYKGYVEKVIFRKESNGYTVFEFVCSDGDMQCVGALPGIDPGEGAVIEGEWTMHPKYGEQFNVSSYERQSAGDAESMRRYLGSGAIKGIGAILADRIIAHFGELIGDVLDREPERLSEVKGISERKAREIAVQFREKSETRAAIMFLQKYGLSINMAVKVYDVFGEEIYAVMKSNPYRLAEEVRGIGFKTADEIARAAGLEADSEYRIASGILYELAVAAGEGDMYLTVDDLKERCCRLLDLPADLIAEGITNLAVERRIIIKDETDDDDLHAYAPEFYYAELTCAKLISDLNLHLAKEAPDSASVPQSRREDAADDLDSRISKLEKELDMYFDGMQREAVRAAATEGIMILTGGPGTGKTTTINAMIRYFVDEGLDIMLAAPTGRAAKRMTEATGYEARTIHRMLELNGAPDEDGNAARFERNEDNPLEADVIILDEMSMVDVFLFKALLCAIVPGTRLIMVGDVDQLPSVGPGQVLRDLIASGAFRVVQLTEVFRQVADSDIIMNAHDVRRGKYPRLDNAGKDFFFLPREDVRVIYKHMVELITGRMGNFPEYVGATPFEMQVLTPSRRGPLGVETLNGILQEYVNPPSGEKKELESGNVRFRDGDKVMQIRNNYQMEWSVPGKYGIAVQSGTGVFNGDLGRVVRIDSDERTMIVEYEEGRQVTYDSMHMDELELAYAVTIHKSQGSEYPAVIIPLLHTAPQLMNRNLLYTAITRAQKCVMILGSEDVVRRMVDNAHETLRKTGLELRIREFT